VKLQFLGANRQVTGSRYCLHAGGLTIVVDSGLFQEREYQSRNWDPCPIDPAQIDFLLITHAHVDHVGLVPKLVREGYRGPILMTRPTVELAELILRDSAEIQVEEAAYKKRRHRREGRRGKHPEEPLYNLADVERTLPLFQAVSYTKSFKLNEHVSATFHDAGHILGSAMIELEIDEDGGSKRLLFSGDIGLWGKPLVRDPTCFEEADYVIMESTYGDRDHENNGDIETQLADAIGRAVGEGGNVVIPTFAVERAQELMYYIGRLVHDDRIPDVPIFLDSPMAVDVTEVFRRHRESFDQETWDLIASGQPPLHFPGLHLAHTVADSKAINDVKGPAIIMATSGMCTAGRIKHHLRQNISRPESTILFVGYQAHGTLGRHILNGSERVRIHGRDWPVRARVERIYGFSGHADRRALLKWLAAFKRPPLTLFLTHGEEDVSLKLAEQVRATMDWTVEVPEYQEVVEIE